ncbi:MAG TPA: hypothetical protein VK667_12055, partial [Ktedonobacteraceae bacterium]|nr:hypothetical protein [Ktedonobacteraceae bacterium]
MTRHCTNCGTPLHPAMTACPTCGKPTTTEPGTSYNPGGSGDSHMGDDAIPYIDFGAFQESASSRPAANQAGQAYPQGQNQALPPQQPAQQANMYTWGQQPGPQMPNVYAPGQQPAGQANMYAPGQTPPPQTPGIFTPGPQFPGQPAQQQPGMYASGQVFQGQQPGTYAPGQMLPGQPPVPVQPQRRGFSGGIIALLVVLVLALIGGSILVYYAAVLHPQQLSVEATSTAHTTQVNNLHATQTASAVAANATATVNALSPQDLYTRITAGTPTLNDPLATQGSTTWSQLGSGDGRCAFTGGALHATSNTGSAACVALGSTYSNFVYQVQVSVIRGDLGGIFFRTDQVSHKLYMFAISPNGFYALYYIGQNASGSASENILAASISTTINTGFKSKNVISVLARGSEISIFIN